MLSLDFFFHYKNIIRFIFCKRFFILNSYLLPSLSKLLIFFNILNLDDISSLSISNCFYLIKYFFGRRLFIVKFVTKFNLGLYYVNFFLESIIRNLDMYFYISFLISDIFPFLTFDYISLILKNKYLNIILKDMSFFSEKKNNVGFFNLKDSLNIKFFIFSKFIYNLFVIKNFFSFLKL